MNTVSTSVAPHPGLLIAEAGISGAPGSPPRAPGGHVPVSADVLLAPRTPGPLLRVSVRAALGARARRTSAARGYAPAGAARLAGAKARSSSASSASTRADPSLAFLKDPKLSIEDKLLRLMAVLNAQYEAEMQQKLDALAGGKGASAAKSSSGSTSKKKGLFAGIGDALKSFFPAAGIALDALQSKPVQAVLKKVGGPVLAAGATALGFPALAPALLEYGPQVVDAAAGAAKALDGAGSGSSSPAASSATSSSGSAQSDGDRQLQMMELQRVQEKQKEMFQLVSNILKSMHDTRFGIVSNIR
jgi:hypothetical protein